MTVLLVPATRENLRRSIEAPVPWTDFGEHLPGPVAERLRKAHPDGAFCWAMTRHRRSTFDALAPGDEVVFSQKGTGRFTHYGRVLSKVHSVALGERLWPKTDADKPWENIYFLERPEAASCSKVGLVTALGYKPNFAVAGPTPVGAARLEAFESRFGTLRRWLGLSDDPVERIVGATLDELERMAETGTLDAAALEDHRKRVMGEVLRRQGQGPFRDLLVAAYGGRCAITGYDQLEALEAAHVHPYTGPKSNLVENGLLLRADLHRLFDRGLITLSPNDNDAGGFTVQVAAEARGGLYGRLHGTALRLPDNGPPPAMNAALGHARWASARFTY